MYMYHNNNSSFIQCELLTVKVLKNTHLTAINSVSNFMKPGYLNV